MCQLYHELNCLREHYFISLTHTDKLLGVLSITKIFFPLLVFSMLLFPFLSLADNFCIQNSSCNKLVPQKISPSAVNLLQKRGFNPVELEKTPIPSGWSISWSTFHQGSKLIINNNHLLIHASKQLILYGPIIWRPSSQDYRMEITLRCPDDAATDTSSVDIGIFVYGMIVPGQNVINTVKISKGESRTFMVPIRLDYDFAPFRAMLKITGDVQLEKYVLFVDREQIKREKRTLVEGTLTELSMIPDPKKSDYANCRFTAHLVGNSILDGVSCPKEINLVIEGFRNYKKLDTANLKVGDKVYCLMLPFENLSNTEKSTQQADDLNLFSLENYYCIGIKKVYEFHDQEFPESGIYFNDIKMKYVSIFERHINPPIAPELVQEQKAAIAAELVKINAMLEPWTEAKKAETNKAFMLAWEKEKSKDVEKGKDYNRVKIGNTTYVWRNMDNSFWCLPVNYTLIGKYKPVSKEKMDALVALKDFLEANGCQFIVSLVPYFYDISARVINPDFKDVPDFATAYMVKQFLESGIETIYGSQEIIKKYNLYPFAFFFPDNHHPSDVTQDVLSDKMAEKLSRFRFTKTLERNKISEKPMIHLYGNDKYLFPKNCDIGKNIVNHTHTCRCILYDGNILRFKNDSPVLVFGNSFIETPMGPGFESYPALLSAKLLIPLSVLQVNAMGSMTTIPLLFVSNPGKYLTGKKVVILQMGMKHFKLDFEFNNVKNIDECNQMLSGKKIIKTLQVKGDTFSNASCNFITVDKTKKTKIIEMEAHGNWDSSKEIVIAVNTFLFDYQNVKLLINGNYYKVKKNSDYAPVHHSLVPVLIPAGIDKIMVEISGTPGHKISIKNIQLFQ